MVNRKARVLLEQANCSCGQKLSEGCEPHTELAGCVLLGCEGLCYRFLPFSGIGPRAGKVALRIRTLAAMM